MAPDVTLQDAFGLVRVFTTDPAAAADVVATMSVPELRAAIGRLAVLVHLATEDVTALADIAALSDRVRDG